MRPLEADDVDAALAIYNHYVANSTATFQTEPLTKAEFAEQVTFADPRHGVWTIDDADRLAGYLLVGPFKARSAYALTAEVTVYLDPAHTGRGLGSRALMHAEHHAKSVGLHALVAIVCGENEASIRLFTRSGYERVAQLREVGRKFDRWLDSVYLERLVAGRNGDTSKATP